MQRSGVRSGDRELGEGKVWLWLGHLSAWDHSALPTPTRAAAASAPAASQSPPPSLSTALLLWTSAAGGGAAAPSECESECERDVGEDHDHLELLASLVSLHRTLQRRRPNEETPLPALSPRLPPVDHLPHAQTQSTLLLICRPQRCLPLPFVFSGQRVVFSVHCLRRQKSQGDERHEN